MGHATYSVKVKTPGLDTPTEFKTRDRNSARFLALAYKDYGFSVTVYFIPDAKPRQVKFRGM